METISVTLIIPGTAASLKYDRVKKFEFSPSHTEISFYLRDGSQIVSNLPYIIAYEQEITN